MSDALKIVPAGAGSGKTYRIKTDLAKLVRDELVRPERIMAVTFTEAAAGELRERIRGTLLADGLVEQALAVERAYVSTIHGLGLRILTEHAFAARRSPEPRHLSDGERDLLIREELAHCEELDPIKADLPRYGYKGAGWAGTTTEDSFRGGVFRTIDLLRGLGDGGTDPALTEQAERTLRNQYGPVRDDPGPLRARLQSAAKELLDTFPEGGTPYGTNGSAAKDFRKQLFALRDARDGRALAHDWKLWEELRKLRLKAQGAKIPERFKDLSGEVIAAADGILKHPGPLEDACTHLRALILGAQQIMSGYAARKRAAGVIDFADMIVDAERLLRMQPEVRRAVIEDIDCLVIDEFQDTNPVQFALLWGIAQAAPRTLLVGDTKQSIMGFQGADPRLTDALVSRFPDHVDPLDRNWRSDPRLMSFVNAISARLFPDNYVALAAQRAATGHTALEVLRMPHGPAARGGKSKPQQNVAARVKAILDDGTTIIDRHSPIEAPAPREVSPGDIAILCRTHAQAARYADGLQSLGVPVRINRTGWMDSAPIIAARNALALAADPSDTHAALCLLTLGPAAMHLQDAMTALTEAHLLDELALAPVRSLAEAAACAPLTEVVAQVITAAGLREWVERMPDAAQMRADLLRLEAEAQAFEDAHRDMKAAAGFYGHTAQVFLGWLHTQREERDFDRHPDSGSGVADGVEIVTWHAAKGREWNITVVVGLDTAIAERDGTLRAEFADFSDLDNVLATAQLTYTPVLPIKEKKNAFIEARRESAEEDARRLLYVAMTRARDRLVLEWPDFALKKLGESDGPANHAEMLVLEAGVVPEAGGVKVGGVVFPARLSICSAEAPDVPECSASGKGLQRVAFGEVRPLIESLRTPWRVRPSLIEPEARLHVETQLVTLGIPPQPVTLAATASERGTVLHKALRVFLTRPDLRPRLSAATGLAEDMLDVLQAQAGALKAWLTSEGYTRIECEVPLQKREASGAEFNGIVDLLATGPGKQLILDHKSGAGSFATYAAQLDAYRELLAQQGEAPMPDVAIHWIDQAQLELLIEEKRE